MRALAVKTEFHLLHTVHMFDKYGVACSHHQQEKRRGRAQGESASNQQMWLKAHYG